jgi:hypothetical protein
MEKTITTTTLQVLLLKHVKYDARSTIDAVVDKDTASLESLFTEDIEKRFARVLQERNTFRLEQGQMLLGSGDVTTLELIGTLRKQHWLLLASHSFQHLSSEKTIETHFYFERPSSSTSLPSGTGTAVAGTLWNNNSDSSSLWVNEFHVSAEVSHCLLLMVYNSTICVSACI